MKTRKNTNATLFGIEWTPAPAPSEETQRNPKVDATIYLMRRELHELYYDVIPKIDEIDNETAFKIFELTIENERGQ